MSVVIVFETHSISVDNERAIATGWLDGRLSPTGRRLAKDLGGRRRDDGVAAAFTSDLRRAVETAEIAFEGSLIPIHQDRRLRECNYGELNGMPVSRLESERLQHVDEPYPGGESYRQVTERIRGFLRDLPAGWDGKRVVIIGHSATRWALDHLLSGILLEDLVAAPFAWQEGWLYALGTV